MNTKDAVISLTAIPPRFQHLEPCLKSLHYQNDPGNLPVHLYVPKYFKRNRTEVKNTDLPQFVKRYCDEVHFVEDEGSITKLRPALREQYSIVITADDDIEYPPLWAAQLLYYAQFYNAVLGYRGKNLVNGQGYGQTKAVEKVSEPTCVNFITGVRGALYRPEFFTNEFLQSTEFTTVDDTDISTELNRNNVPIYIIPPTEWSAPTSAIKIQRLAKMNVWKGETDRQLKLKGFWESIKE